MKILTSITVDTTVNGIDLAALNSQVTTNTNALTSKADESDLPILTEDQVPVGVITNIDLNLTAGSMTIICQGGSYEIVGLDISQIA